MPPRLQQHRPRAAPRSRFTELWIQGIYGLGDNLFQRPFVRAALQQYSVVYLTTSWPELYMDLPEAPDRLRFIRPTTILRTQAKNISRQSHRLWSAVPRSSLARRTLKTVSTRYMPPDLEHGSIVSTMERAVPLNGLPFVFDLPSAPASPPLPRRYAVVRPVTERKEWHAPARSPKAEYVAEAARALQARGLAIVSVADLDPPNEWLVGPEPAATHRFHHGELGPLDLCALLRDAECIVGGVGWILPMGVAAKVPTVIIGGGLGAHNHPNRVTDPRMGLEQLRWILPDDYHMCGRKECNDCNKRIQNFPVRFQQTLNELLSTGTGTG